MTTSAPHAAPWWTRSAADLMSELGATRDGLTAARAATRLAEVGPNELREHERLSHWRVLRRQIASPLILLLVFAAIVSFATGEWVDAGIVLVIVLASVGVGYRREYVAERAADALQARVRTTVRVLRDGQPIAVPRRDIVPGDVVLLAAGSLVPADGLILEATDCYVSEAVLTGESFPVEKHPTGSAPSAASAPTALAERPRDGAMFLGTNVRSGSARCLVVKTGTATELGAIAHRLILRPPETEFERGLHRFGYLLMVAMLVMVLLVFGAHMFRGRPAGETLLFAIALAVGLSPELLPAILGINLARAASMMASHGVLVRRLDAIENLGSMDVLCTDKTGTITEGVVEVDGAWDPVGARADGVLELAAVNAALETGLANPLDDALLATRTPELGRLTKLAEVPFDFIRKRLSVIVRDQDGGGVRIIMKGAFEHVLEVATTAAGQPLDAARKAALDAMHEGWASRGMRVIAVATRTLPDQPRYGRDDERDLDLVGFVTFADRPKAGVGATIAALGELGVQVKVITGDSALVARHVAQQIGLPEVRVLTGDDLDNLHDEALWRAAERTDIFAEVDPNQKERIIGSLRKMGHVVGFLGDGVNDAPAMHAADTSLSVEKAVDVAREAADFVLLEPDLEVIKKGIEEGRRTFANTLKYILTTTSANLGNMVSMAVASLFLPFLPLTAGQILLNNFLSDLPAVGIATDAVDVEMVAVPRRWDIRFIGRYMVEFGILSSLFDLLTFALLLGPFHAGPERFRTGWFIESLLTELVIALVVRTRRPFWQSRPGRLLLISTIVLALATLLIPYLPGVPLLGFEPIPLALLAVLVGVTALYVFATEALKRWFYRRARV
ncbi:MAG: magnesium-translocating P-type ATPase [Myxococcota bacterium]